MKSIIASQRDNAMSRNAASFLIDRHVLAGAARRTAIVHAHGTLTYGELAAAINQVAHYLQQLGVQPEQRVALHLHDGPQFVFFFMAALKIGAVAVPVNTFSSAEALAFYLEDSRARVLITHRRYAGKLADSGGSALLGHVVNVEDEPWKTQPIDFEPVAVSQDDSAFWLYTSGSTGVQKAVMHRHGGLTACAQAYCRDVIGITDSDRCYSASKLFFAYGLGNSLIFPLSAGATSILNADRSEPDTVIRTIREFKPTLFFSVPTLYNALLGSDGVDHELFASVRMCISAGEYLPESLFEGWQRRTGQVLYDGIGSTESMHIFCSNRPASFKAGTSGRPVAGYELKIVDPEGASLPPMSVGRLFVRGKTLAKGYWNRHEANQGAFFGEWLATGDIYQQTEEGYFKYIGRQDDVFKSSGLWVSPGEIEQALLAFPGVREAAVVAVKNSTGLTGAKAFVVLNEAARSSGDEQARRELYRHLEGRLSKYKVPAAIEFIGELPKTSTGKVSRAELRRSHAEPVLANAAAAN